MADGYSAGDLYLNIESVADDTIKKLDAIIERLNIINKGLGGVTKTSKLSEMNSNSSRRTRKDNSLGGMLNLGKWTAVLFASRRLGRAVANIAQAGADYTETLNLWQVAMGENLLPQSEKFIERLNEAYGISEKTLMNAQATFKNMLGGLGQISDEMAYNLSEGITQMALDYASLYNVQFEQAFTKFQAALAGQVRPIRSVSGYDITENTLFQLYQELGGQKTMRQLSRTEKQLLSILAVFEQMDNTGAVGDLKKTIDSFANQSRVAADSWDRILTFAGAIVTELIESSGLFIKLNAVLIFIGDTLKGVADEMGALEGVADPFANANNGAEELIENTNKVYGLLDFDKFRVLDNSQSKNALGLDNSILKGFEKYNSILANAKNSATELANSWKKTFDAETLSQTLSVLLGISTVLGAKGILNIVRKLGNKFSGLGETISSAFSLKNIGIMALISGLYYLYTTNEDFRESVNKLFLTLTNLLNQISEPLTNLLTVAVDSLATIMNGLAPILIVIIDITTAIIGFLDEAGLIEPLVYGIIAAIATFKITSFINDLTKFFSELLFKVSESKMAIASLTKSTQILLTTGISVLVTGIFSFIHAWDDMSGIQTAIGILSALAGALTAVAIAFHATHNWGKAIGIGAMVAGGALTVSSTLSSIDMFANGGVPDKGTMFYAGEAGAEIVYNTPSGQSGVANVQQIAQATYAGTTQALNDWWVRARGDMPQFAPASDSGLYERVTAQAGLRGDHWSK